MSRPCGRYGALLQQLHKMNQGLDTTHWRVYELGEEPNGVCHALSIDFPSVVVLGKMGWQPFSGMGRDLFPSWCKTRRKEVGSLPNVLWPTDNIVALLLEFLLKR